MIDFPLASETEEDQHEKSPDKIQHETSPDNTVSVEDNMFSEKPTMGLRRSTRIKRALD